MKARSVKLREAHNANTSGISGDGPSSSLCTILWDADAARLVTASSNDLSVLIHDVSHQPSFKNAPPPRALRYHKDGVTCLALSPDSLCLASGSVDHCVKLHDFPSGEFQSNVTRFTLPIRSLAFNKSGSLLAAAGDDDGIKLIATIDSSIAKVLKGHKGVVTGLSFDPNNEYLASVDGNGTVIFWELSSGKQLHTLKAVAPDCGSDGSISNVLCWSPDGEILSVPGLRNDVVMYDRDTAEKMFSLKGEHERRVCFMAWSPNGKYMATSSLDKQILIWDIDLRQDIERQKFDNSISCLSWKPNGNALAVIDVMGRFGVWDNPVPTCMKSPTDGAPDLQLKKTSGLSLFNDEEEEEDANNSFSSDNSGGDDFGGSAPISRKKRQKQFMPGEKYLDDDDSDGQDDLLRQIESHKSDKHDEGKARSKGKERVDKQVKHGKPKMQEAFQPCSTPAQYGKRHFLCFNMVGTITTLENEGYSHIEVDFHDTGKGSRVPSMTDYFGFTMASLSETGSVFANPGKGEKKTSTLMYRPFGSWANNSEWSMRFEAEEVKVVTLGTGWIAAVTDLNFLRIFTEGGLQKYILSLHGAVVTAAGFKDRVAVVTHASDCLYSGEQMLEVKVFNLSTGTLPISCHLPLTPGSCLSWFGFSEEGLLSAFDSKGVLRVFSDHFGGCWLPLFSVDKVRQSEEENFWVVGLNASKIFCVVCKPPDLYPTVMPRPILTLFNLSLPLASSDLGAGDLENELAVCDLHISHLQMKNVEMIASGLETTNLDDELFDLEAARDRCILKLIAQCCNGDKLVRATELAKLLSLKKSVKCAIKLATGLKLPILAEIFNSMLEERLLSENAMPAATGMNSSSVPTLPLLLPQFQPVPQPTARPNSSMFSKQEKVEDKSKMVEQEKAPCITSMVEKAEVKPKLVNQKKEPSRISSEMEKHKVKRTDECKLASSGKSMESNNQPQLGPLVNPFAKVSNNQEKTSLFDSLKRLNKVNDEKKGGINKKMKV